MVSPIRQIVVCLDGSLQGRALGRQAAALARRLDAGLIGLWGLHRPSPSAPETFARGAGAIHDVLEHQALQEQDLLSVARRDFDAIAGPFGLKAEFHPAWDDDPDAAALAAVGDLVVIGHPRLRSLPGGLTAERLLLTGSRPVLLLPAAWTGNLAGPVLIGWNGSPAARRAAEEALPLMAAEGLATVVVVDRAASDEATTQLTQALRARGLRTTVKAVDSGGAGVAEAILRTADEVGAGLVVLGGYSRSPTVERWFGGVTRSLLATAPRPLLLSHLPEEARRAAAGDRAAVGTAALPGASFR
ncbi:universal stress protein [Brevundimonas sp.]|uniref:universal stress protein n=1 Tax=Brevundimonas sp. TaxID=1871086 RepID=UPI002D7550AF|nr:universal stress protein [Brevundimonas sp.]HYD27718.1 universal stress protein [Brevundimonas sp.]